MIQFNSLPVIPLRITSRFGARNTGIVGATTNHPGIDLGRDKTKPETAILAVKSGTVSQNYWNNVRGWVIVLQHDGFVTLYQHLKTQSPLKVGSRISSGQIIGTMGNSSKTLIIVVHLHFELRVNGLPVDPEPYLKNIVPEVKKVVYKTLNDIPEWGKSTIQKLITKGYLQGDTSGYLNISEDMLRLLVINDRAGVYGK